MNRLSFTYRRISAIFMQAMDNILSCSSTSTSGTKPIIINKIDKIILLILLLLTTCPVHQRV